MEACRKQRFRKWDREQEMLLPPSVREYVSEGHAANMIVAIVQERDREAIEVASKAASEQKKPKGRPRKHPLGTPKGKEQYNRVDPESRIMKSPDGYVQGYNVQIAVDAQEQVIVAQGVTQQAVDVQQLEPMVEAIKEGMKKRPKEVSADAGYCSNGNIALLEEQNIRAYVAVGNGKNPGTGKGPNASGLSSAQPTIY